MSIKLVQHCIGTSYTQCCPNTSERTLHKKINGAMLCQTTQSSFRWKITICNVVLICLSQHYTRKIPAYCWPILHKQFCTKKIYNVVWICLCPHCTRKLPVQCWFKVQEQLCNFAWASITQGNHLCNVCPWLTDNFYGENNLCNVVSTMLGQYCIGILSSQCWANTSERTLHKKITCAMLAQSAQQWFWR